MWQGPESVSVDQTLKFGSQIIEYLHRALLQSMSAALGGSARSGELTVVSPPPWASRPQGHASFPAHMTSQHAEGLHECLALLETDSTSPPYISSFSSTLGTSSYLHIWPLLSKVRTY